MRGDGAPRGVPRPLASGASRASAHGRWAILFALCVGCAPAPEVDLPFRATGAFGAYTLADGALVRDGERVLDRVYAAPVGDPTRLFVAADGVDNGAIYLLSGDQAPVAVVTGGRPDRLAIGPDGTLAYVSGVTGLPSVWVRAPDAAARQLTNVGVAPTPGARPPGFVDPPRSAPVFDGDWLRWDGGEVRWR